MTPEVRRASSSRSSRPRQMGRAPAWGSRWSYGIVKQAGGHICVYSEAGQGHDVPGLPPALGEPIRGRARPRAAGAREGSETILLVEDDAASRGIGSRDLEDEGVGWKRPSRDSSMSAAIPNPSTWCNRRRHAGMSGRTWQRLTGAPRAPRSSISRATRRTIVLRRGVIDKRLPLLTKPFTPSQLAHQVRRTLDGAVPVA